MPSFPGPQPQPKGEPEEESRPGNLLLHFFLSLVLSSGALITITAYFSPFSLFI